jgi:hypothetical protein
MPELPDVTRACSSTTGRDRWRKWKRKRGSQSAIRNPESEIRNRCRGPRVTEPAFSLYTVAMTSEAAAEEAVRYALRRRGVRCGRGRHYGAIVPAPAAAQKVFYDLLKRYSFRLFLRDLIQLHAGAEIGQLTRYCSPATAERFVAALAEIGVVRRGRGGRVRLADQTIHSFGPTLEWFVARALRHELGVATAWSLRPDGAGGGGDYDVVGVADGALIYVEVKSSAPRNIEQNQIRAFAGRVATLAPEVAILLNDTQLRMYDKLLPALQLEWRQVFGRAGRWSRVVAEIFSWRDRLFVTNSDPDLVGNLGICLERYYRSRGALPASSPVAGARK